MRNLIYGVLLFTIAQAIIWIQTNGQFVWPWFKKNPFLVSLAGGTLISYVFIKGTWLVAEHFNGALWPGRFIGFSTGIFIFTFMTYYFMKEGINIKTAISLVLAFALISVLLFWK